MGLHYTGLHVEQVCSFHSLLGPKNASNDSQVARVRPSRPGHCLATVLGTDQLNRRAAIALIRDGRAMAPPRRAKRPCSLYIRRVAMLGIRGDVDYQM